LMFSFQGSVFHFRPAILCLLRKGGLVVMHFFYVRSFQKFRFIVK
jgi:hypothetical protein